MNQNFYEMLVRIAGEQNVCVDEAMKKHTTFRVGGNADYLVTPTDADSVARLVECCKREKVDFYIIGNGSNLLVSDNGYRGVIIKIYNKMNSMVWNDNIVTAQAGCLLSVIGHECAARSLTGFEFASGIPGTLGGAVAMNAGAYGGEMADCVEAVRMLSDDGTVRWYDKSEMAFGYRQSKANMEGLIVLEVKISLNHGIKEEIDARMEELRAARITKQPLEYPSAGSTFKRPEGHYAGKLIEEAGLKGLRHGGACVSPKHSGFVINDRNATAAEILELIEIIKAKVYEKSGVKLEMEVKKIGDF